MQVVMLFVLFPSCNRARAVDIVIPVSLRLIYTRWGLIYQYSSVNGLLIGFKNSSDVATSETREKLRVRIVTSVFCVSLS